MPSCENYYGKVFAHLAAAGAVAAISAEKSDLGDQILGGQTPLVSALLNLGISLALLFATILTAPGGIPKYAFFLAFAFWIGQGLKPLLARLTEKGDIGRILTLTTGVFVAMAAIGFYDKQNMLGFGPYLFAGLLGLIVAQLFVYALATPSEKKGAVKIFQFVGVALFAALTAYDVQVVKVGAKFCKKLRARGFQPDYPSESLGLFLDAVNLFSLIGSGDN